MKGYDHKKIEKKWQAVWEKKKINQAQNSSKKPKFYSLIEFPYPSGDGLHVGHIRSNTAMDIISRKRRAEGYNVLYPIGWDAFGLPTENYAIKTGKQPRVITKKNADTFRRQLKAVGFSFDWSREINTTDPKYYKWTQWIFLQFLKKGLAYKAKIMINWCPKDKIGLANEEVIAGCCERCGTIVEKREKEQWMLAITKYADRLDKDLDMVDYLPKIKLAQRNWIGRSEGVEINFNIAPGSEVVKVFTTRADTLFGVTYLVLAPEHSLIQGLKPKITNWDKVLQYVVEAKGKVEMERTAADKEKTGVELKGIKAINPATGEEIPVWIADYVLAGYGTGAIMAVPAHDERDFEFAKKYKLEVRYVVRPVFGSKHENAEPRQTITAVIQRKKDGKFLMVYHKDLKYITPVIGGIDDGETAEEAAVREVMEETGYLTKSIGLLGPEIESHFFAEHKNVWRERHDHCVVLNITNTDPIEVTKQESDKQEVKWMSFEEIVNQVPHQNNILPLRWFLEGAVYKDKGIMTNSGRFDGMDSEVAKKEIIKFVGGKEKVTFKLRDWVFSRQRYWGEPIPVINCGKCGLVPVPEKDLPVELPKVKNYQPTDSGESPLANISKWVNVKCPKCKSRAKRETDTMPNWAGSSWYYLRYTDPKNAKTFADKKNLKYWTPVDWYNGGNEHTTLHLLYSRFWHKFLFDLKLVPTSEPYKKRTSHGLILAAGGEKMSKSKGNVINPDVIVGRYGADTLRLYEMFMGPFDQAIAWSEEAIIGPRRFLEKVWRIGASISENQKNFSGPRVARAKVKDMSELNQTVQNSSGFLTLQRILNKTIKKVTEDIELTRFNTAVSSMMILTTEMEKSENVSVEDFKIFLKILSPFAPHITEELWNVLGEKKSIHLSPWPKYDPEMLKDEEIKIAVQINGKVRTEMMIPADAEEEYVKEKVLNDPVVLKYTAGETPKKVIYIKNRLINIVL